MDQIMNQTNFHELAVQIKGEIDKAKTILLCCHPSADPDSVGSVLSLMYYLESVGKKVVAIRGDDELSKANLTLPGAERILNKNFTEIDFNSCDLLIATDVSAWQQVTKLVAFDEKNKSKIIVIDHHETNEDWGFVNCVIKDSPATAQIIYDLFAVWGVNLSSEIAKCLFAGIYADTGGFKYPMTTAHTFEIAQNLIKIAPDFAGVIFGLENSYEPENIKFVGLALSLIETYFSGSVAISPVSLSKMQAVGIKPVLHTAKMEISNILKSVVGWNISAVLVEKEGCQTGVSLRTRDADKWDVSKIAKALGGGGHKAAAGATINQPLAEAKEQFLLAVESLFPDLGSR